MGTSHSTIEGVMIINKYKNNMLQIGHLDAPDGSTLKRLIAFVMNLAYDELTEKRCEKIQMFIPHIPFLQSVMTDLWINHYAEFMLYRMELF